MSLIVSITISTSYFFFGSNLYFFKAKRFICTPFTRSELNPDFSKFGKSWFAFISLFRIIGDKITISSPERAVFLTFSAISPGVYCFTDLFVSGQY